jgi:glucose-1-phosphate cytidylyltransferase
MATVTAVKPPVRFGHMKLMGKEVVNFGEKNNLDAEWINGGFFILEPNVTNYIKGDNDSFEFDVLPKLVQERELMAFSHDGFWKPMDTLKEQRELNLLAGQKNPPWLEDI